MVAVKDDPGLDIAVRRVVPFTPATLDRFNLELDGVTSADLSSSSTDEEVSGLLSHTTKMMTDNCQVLFDDN